MISTRILADSINPAGTRLTSWLLTYPRFIHSEFMTHRCFSRNAASSRATPFKKMLNAVNENPALPEYWSREHKGMQAVTDFTKEEIDELRERGDGQMERRGLKWDWLSARDNAMKEAIEMSETGLAKSLCNRLLEPFAHITVLATATDGGLANFFALRAHPAAQPEFQVLAYRMLNAYLKSDPVKHVWGSWHIPHFGNESIQAVLGGMEMKNRIKVATARCARLSYLTFDGAHSPEKDIELHDRLAASGHWSPFEHCARAQEEMFELEWSSNFDINGSWSGWLQYRKFFPEENQTKVNLQTIYETKPDWILVNET